MAAADDCTQTHKKRRRMELNLNEPPRESSADFTDPPDNPRPRKPTKHWKPDEHELFLEGVRLYGRGNWREISKLVDTKTPAQVASHAQKHFNKLKGKNKRQSESDPNCSSTPQSVEPLREIHPACLFRTIEITPEDMDKVNKMVSLLEQVSKV